jgi:hypothetical protein
MTVSCGRRHTASRLWRTFADSLYRRLTPNSTTSAPSIASLIAVVTQKTNLSEIERRSLVQSETVQLAVHDRTFHV